MNDIQYKIYHFFRYKVARCKEGEVGPKWLNIVWFLVNPIGYIVHRNIHKYYDIRTDMYNFNGSKATGSALRTLFDKKNKGMVFEIIDAGEAVTIKTIYKP